MIMPTCSCCSNMGYGFANKPFSHPYDASTMSQYYPSQYNNMYDTNEPYSYSYDADTMSPYQSGYHTTAKEGRRWRHPLSTKAKLWSSAPHRSSQ